MPYGSIAVSVRRFYRKKAVLPNLKESRRQYLAELQIIENSCNYIITEEDAGADFAKKRPRFIMCQETA